MLFANGVPLAFREFPWLLPCKKLTASAKLMNTVLGQGQLLYLTNNWQMLGTNQSDFCLPWPMSSSPYRENLQLLLLWWAMAPSFSFLSKLSTCRVVCSISLYGVGCDVKTSPSAYLAGLLCRCWGLFYLSDHTRDSQKGVASYIQMRLNSTVGCEVFKDSQWQYFRSCALEMPM